MTLRTDTAQEELVPAKTRFVPYRCDFCRMTYMRPEGRTTCPGCGIGPMRAWPNGKWAA